MPAAAQLARTLLLAGIADPADWKSGSGADLLAFIDATVRRLLQRHGVDTITRELALTGTLMIEAGEAGEPSRRPTEPMPPRPPLTATVTVTADCARMYAIGDTVTRLEALDPRLASTFYRSLLTAWQPFVRVYGEGDAYEYFDNVVEMYAPEELAAGGIEIPDYRGFHARAVFSANAYPDAAIGRQVARYLRQPTLTAEDRAALAALRDVAGLAAAAEALVRRPRRDECEAWEQYDGVTAPAVVLITHERDLIETAFDEEAPQWMEYTPAPSILIRFDATNAAAARREFDHIGKVVAHLAAVAAVCCALPGNAPLAPPER